jgi:hypothetical protein
VVALLLAQQRRVAPGTGEELLMGATLDDAPLVDHDDQIRLADRRQPVRDDQAGAIGQQRFERGLDQLLVVTVERARRLVEDEDARVLEERARDREPLPLAA